jgi:serine/threonine-protein kinase
MSPEQAEGDLEHLGPRSDVYSLGATLYALLTGQAPFAGDAADVIPRVPKGDFRPPRQVDPALDRALVAVCLQAMALRPADRYATPKALAEDVERWMAGETVSAWREPIARRARRWARRNRTAVSAATVAVLAGVVGLGAVLGVQTRANAQLRDALGREARANAELTRAKAGIQARYDLAVEAIETFHTGVSEDFLLKEEPFKDLRDRLLKSASDFYGKLGALLGQESDLASRRSLGQANYEVAELTGKVGSTDDALAVHRRVLAYREALAGESGVDTDTRADVGRSLTAVASLLSATSRIDEAVATYGRAERMLAELAREQSPETAASTRAALAACRSRLGLLWNSTGHPDEALAMLRLARNDQEALVGVAGAAPEARRDLAATISHIGVVLSQKGRQGEALAQYRIGLAIRQELADDHPAVTAFRRGVAWNHHQIGILLGETGRPAEALAEFGAALAIRQKLAADNPTVTVLRSELAWVHHSTGLLLTRSGQPAESMSSYHEELAILEKLTEQNPGITAYRSSLANAAIDAASALLSLGRRAEARALCERAVGLNEAIMRAEPQTPEYHGRLAESLMRRGQAQRAEGDAAGAAADWRRAVAIFDGLPSPSGESRVLAACFSAGLAGIAGSPGSRVSAAEGQAEAEKAIDLLRRAVALGIRDLAWLRTEAMLDPLRARPDFQALLMDLAMPEDSFARDDWEKAPLSPSLSPLAAIFPGSFI